VAKQIRPSAIQKAVKADVATRELEGKKGELPFKGKLI